MPPLPEPWVSRDWPAGTFLSKLPVTDRKALLDLGIPRWHSAGETLFRQGDKGDSVLVLLDAVVMVKAGAENGVETLIAIRVSGDLVGEMAVIDDTTRFATITTCRRSLISHIPGPVFLDCLRRRPSVALTVNRMLSERLRQAGRRRLDFAGYGVEVRLCRALLELADRYGRMGPTGAIDVGVRLSHAEYGALIGATKESVQRALRRLATKGLVETGRRRVLITDKARLAKFADIVT